MNDFDSIVESLRPRVLRWWCGNELHTITAMQHYAAMLSAAPSDAVRLLDGVEVPLEWVLPPPRGEF